jgi:hypothetical protein
MQQFITLFLESTGKPFYMGSQADIAAMDNTLLGVQPINEMLRTPRSLKFRSLFKATEYRNVSLFYSVVLFKDRLPLPNLKHWLLFVNAMRLLFKKKIKPSHIELARALIVNFIIGVQDLYGSAHVSYNVHLLFHMVDYVKMWGAPWRSSAFLFEHVGGVMAKRFHGSTHINKHIFSSFFAANALKRFAINHIPNASAEIQQFYEELHCNVFPRHGIPSETIGKGHVHKLTSFEIQLLEDHLDFPLHCHTCVKFRNLKITVPYFLIKTTSH